MLDIIGEILQFNLIISFRFNNCGIGMVNFLLCVLIHFKDNVHHKRGKGNDAREESECVKTELENHQII